MPNSLTSYLIAYENAGYSAFGRLYAIGYIRGLRQAVYAEQDGR